MRLSSQLSCMIKFILIDWGRTLHDPESGTLYPEVPQVITRLSRHYQLAIVSLAKNRAVTRGRWAILRQSGLLRHFDLVIFGIGHDKALYYNRALRKLHSIPRAVLVIDDRRDRGIRWARDTGASSVWLNRTGKSTVQRRRLESGNHFSAAHLEEVIQLLPNLKQKGFTCRRRRISN